jgi:hypothetical protein
MSVVMRSTIGSRSDVNRSTRTGVITPRITAYSAIVCPASRRIACRAVTATPPANVSGGRTAQSEFGHIVVKTGLSGIPPTSHSAKARWYRWRPRADVAQLVEHWLPKPRVAGSSPVVRSKGNPRKCGGFVVLLGRRAPGLRPISGLNACLRPPPRSLRRRRAVAAPPPRFLRAGAHRRARASSRSFPEAGTSLGGMPAASAQEILECRSVYGVALSSIPAASRAHSNSRRRTWTPASAPREPHGPGRHRSEGEGER